MNLLTQNEWQYQRDKDLADLFYYSLRFGNHDLVKDCAQKWKEKYGEIVSLFYFSETYDGKESPQLVGYYILKNFQSFDMLDIDSLKKLKSLGLVFHNVADLLILSMKKKNITMLDFFCNERKENLKNGTYFVKGDIKAFIPSLIRQSVHSLEIFKHILNWNENLPVNTALAYGLGHALARDKAEVVTYIKDNSNYTKVLTELNLILETTKNEFAIMAKNGRFGDYEILKGIIIEEFENHLSSKLSISPKQKALKI